MAPKTMTKPIPKGVKMDAGSNRLALQEKSREIAKAMWSGKLTANEQAALSQVCQLYGLDPLLKQVVCLGGNIYITKSGLLNIAYRKPEASPDGIETVPASPEERERARVPDDSHFWKVILWKKGCSKAFIEFGEANESNVNLNKKDWRSVDDMAKTRGVNRALRNAYAIGLTSLEEMGYDERQVVEATVVEEPAVKPNGNGHNLSDLLAGCAKAKAALGEAAYYTILKGFQVEHANALTLEQLRQFLALCREQYKANTSGNVEWPD